MLDIIRGKTQILDKVGPTEELSQVFDDGHVRECFAGVSDQFGVGSTLLLVDNTSAARSYTGPRSCRPKVFPSVCAETGRADGDPRDEPVGVESEPRLRCSEGFGRNYQCVEKKTRVCAQGDIDMASKLLVAFRYTVPALDV